MTDKKKVVVYDGRVVESDFDGKQVTPEQYADTMNLVHETDKYKVEYR